MFTILNMDMFYEKLPKKPIRTMAAKTKASENPNYF